MRKKNYSLLVAILLIGVFGLTFTSNYQDETGFIFNDTSISETTITKDPLEVATSIDQHDPRGYLTGRFFNARLNDTGGSALYEQLLLDVEVYINQTTSPGYLVFVSMQDRSFTFYNENGDYEDNFGFTGYSNPENLPVGAHNITVVFNCTEMRALKLPGPYFVVRVELRDWSDFSEVDALDTHDYYKPIYVIDDPNIVIANFDDPDETNDLTFNNATLVNDILEVNFSFQSFIHSSSVDELYYFRITLQNATGATIVHHQQTMVLQQNTGYDIILKIPSEYLTAFKTHGGYTGDFPTIVFQELTVMQLKGYNSPFESFNMSYMYNVYTSTSINVSDAAPIDVFNTGTIHNYGSLVDNDTVDFIIYSDDPDDILKLVVNRSFTMGLQLPGFHITVVNGWGRHRDIYQGMFDFIVWYDWWGMSGTETEKTTIYTHIGKYSCPWRFFIHYPEDSVSGPPQDLTIEVDIFKDNNPPTITLSAPSMGDTFKEYHGIPIQGQTNDDSFIVRYDIICNHTTVQNYNMGDMNNQMPGNTFSFVLFPPEGLTGNSIDLTIKAIDLGGNTDNETVIIDIIPGTKPTPMSTIDKGIQWLRNHQNTDGSWSYYNGPSAGMTALATLCFIQAGLSYDQVVIDAINFLRNSFEDDPDPNVPGKVIRQSGHMTYESAMATTTLIAYNATLPSYDSSLDSLIDDAVNWLVATQNDETWGVDPSEAWYGGWRYGHDHDSSDLSVSQWVFLALSSYDYDDTSLWNKVDTFVRRCRGGYWNSTNMFNPDGGFTYTPSTVDWRDWGGSSYGSMTAAGIWGLYLSGSSVNDPDIISALNWINNTEDIVGGNPYMGNQFEYYWYLSASKAFLMAGRIEDQWWYDEITNYLNTHMIEENPTSAYWDNSMGQESPVFATVQAILSQQVYHGEIPIQTLEVSLESTDGSAIYLWNSTIKAGYNYTTGNEETSSIASYSGLLTDKQIISILSPSKGDYFIDVFPAAGNSGISNPQEMILRGRALTATGHILRYKTEVINYPYTYEYPIVLRYQMVLSTVSGLDIFFLFDGYESFNNNISIDNVICPSYVEMNEQFSVTVTLTNIGTGHISSGTVFTKANDFSDQSSGFTTWAQGIQQIYTFNYDPTGLPAGIRTIIVGVIGDNSTPSLVRVKVQIGNRIPVGTLNNIDNVLSGTEIISWNITDPDGDSLTFSVILINPDGSEDTLTSGITNQAYSFDTTDYPDNTGYKIAVIANDGTDTARFESGFFEILNTDDSDDSSSSETPNVSGPGFEVISSIMAISLIIVWYRRKK